MIVCFYIFVSVLLLVVLDYVSGFVYSFVLFLTYLTLSPPSLPPPSGDNEGAPSFVTQASSWETKGQLVFKSVIRN